MRDLSTVALLAAAIAGSLFVHGAFAEQEARKRLDHQLHALGDAIADTAAASLRSSRAVLARLDEEVERSLRLKATFLSDSPRESRRVLRQFASAVNVRRLLVFDPDGELAASIGDSDSPTGDVLESAFERAARELVRDRRDALFVREWRVPGAGLQPWLAYVAPLPDGGTAVLLQDAGMFAEARRAAGPEAMTRRLEEETPLVYIRFDAPAPATDAERVLAVERDVEGGTLRIGIDRTPLLEAMAVQRRTTWLYGVLLVAGVSLGAFVILRLRRHRADLAARVQRDARLAGLGRLSANIAHEVRNPLNAIGIAMQRLQRADVPAHVGHLADAVLGEVARLDRTVAKVLEYARPAAPRVTRLAAQALLDKVATIARPEADDAGVTVTVVATTESFAGDADLLQGALLNLVRNAVQASPHGGTVTLRATRLALHVEDEGPGVPDALRERLFEPFQREGKTGAGLGLGIALSAAQAHGGTIDVENRAEGGARFTIRLGDL